MESAGSPWEKKFSFSFNSTILRPRPAFARNPARSNVEVLLSVALIDPPSRQFGGRLLGLFGAFGE
jgi:hypothetical protein